MKKYIIKQDDYIKARNTLENLRKLLKQRNLAMVSRGLLELNDIFLNLSVESCEDK